MPTKYNPGFQVKVVTSDGYVKCDSGLIYLDILVGKGDCPKDGQQVILLFYLERNIDKFSGSTFYYYVYD